MVKLWAYNQGEKQAKRCLAALRVARGGTKVEVKGQPFSILPGKTKLIPIKVENLAAGDQVNITVECRNDKNILNNSYRPG